MLKILLAIFIGSLTLTAMLILVLAVADAESLTDAPTGRPDDDDF